MSDVAELSASRRFVAVEHPTALPGCCYTCRNDEGPFVDTGISEDFFGQVIICEKCILEMAQNFDVPDPNVWLETKAKAERLETKVSKLESANRKYKDELDGIRTVLGNFGRDDSNLSVRPDNATSDVQDDTETPTRERKKERSFLSAPSDRSSESDSS